jgi:Zn-dependent protease
MHERGYLTLGSLFGVRLRVHVLAILGALLFTGFRFEPGAWLGFFLLILLHEAGHAFFVRRYGLGVTGIDLHVFGGVCRWYGTATAWQRAVISWGGVVAQAVLLAAAVGVTALTGPVHSLFLADLVSVFTATNLLLIAVNLLPFAPLDGKEAWSIVPAARDRARAWMRRRAADKAQANLWSSQTAGRSKAKAPTVAPEEAARIARAFEDAVRKTG